MYPIGPQPRPAGPDEPGLDYAGILDALPDAVLVHDASTGKILEVNRGFLELFGYAPSVLGSLDLDMLTSGEEPYTPAGGQALIRAALERGLAEFPWHSRRADGSLFWSEVRLTASGGRVVAVVRDVSASVQAEEAMRLAEEKFETIFRSSPASVILSSHPGGRMEEANETMLRLTGYTRAELVGCDSEGLWLDRAALERYRVQLRTRGRVEAMEALFRMKSGDVKVGRVSAEVIELSGGPRVLTVIEDITAMKTHEAALTRLSRLYAALSQVNQSIIRVRTTEELYQGICRALVEGGGFWAAWIAAPDPHTHRFLPLAIAGGRENWLEGLAVSADPRVPEGRGSMGRAYREGRPVVINDFGSDPSTEPWKAEGRIRGFRAAASFPLRLGDGTVFGVLCLYSAEPGYFGEQELALLGEVCQDITFALEDLAREARRRRAEAEKDHLRELLQSIIDSTPDLVYAKDPTHRYLLVNRSMAAFLGREPAGLIGHRDSEFWPGSAMEERMGIRLDEESALYGEVVTREAVITPPSGGEARIFDTLKAPLRDSTGCIEGVLGYARDISGQRRQEEQQRSLELRLQQSEKLESLGNLAGGVAHDLNNVLGAILGLASLELERGAGTCARSMETIRQACVRGRGVVQGLLCFARREPGTLEPVDLNRLAREIVALLSHTTLQRVRFSTDLEPDLRTTEGDPGALNHAVMNICVNSLDAMPRGGTLTLRTRNAPDGSVTLEIEDTGEGMPEDVLLRATEPFFTTKPVGKGTGLGLAMVYGTVRAHKGTLTLASQVGEGTQVRLSFPGSDARVDEEAEVVEGPPVRGLTLLVVDDDDLLRESVADVLLWQGHQVDGAAGGQEALDLLAGDKRYDLVILDLNMPGLSGGETLPRILALRPDQKVLISSGYVDAAVKAMQEGRPQVGLLPKPFTIQELGRKVRELSA